MVNYNKYIFFLLCTKEKDQENKIAFSFKKDNDEIIENLKHEKISSNENNDTSLYKISYMMNGDFEETIVVTFKHNENNYSTKIHIPNDYTNIFYYDNKWEYTKNKSILIPINLSQMFDEFCNIQEDNLFEDLYPQTLEKVKGEKDFELFMKLFIKLSQFSIEEGQGNDNLNKLLKSFEYENVNYNNNEIKNELMEETLNSIKSLYVNNIVDDDNLHALTLTILIHLKKSISDFLKDEDLSDREELKKDIITYLGGNDFRDVDKEDISALINIIKKEIDDEDYQIISLLKRSSKRFNDVLDILNDNSELFKDEVMKQREDGEDISIKIDNTYVEPHKDDDIQKVIEKMNGVLSNFDESNIVSIDEILWEKYFDVFKGDCDKLYKFWTYCEKIVIDKDKVKKTLYDKILNDVEHNQLKNEKLFQLLKKTKDIFIEYQKEQSISLTYLSNAINLDKVNNEYINSFRDVDFKSNIFGQENQKLYLKFVKNLFSKCNTTNDCYNAMCLFDYLNKTISHEEIKIVIEHLMPISQDDKIEQKTINNIASIIIAILNSSPNNEINEIATKLFEYVNHNMKSHVMSQCFINEKSQKIKEELFKHININNPIMLNKIINDTSKQVKNDKEHFQQLCLFFLDKLKSKTISIENDLFYYNNQENNDNNEEDDNSLNNFKLYNLFNRELQLFESKNNNMYLNTDYYTQTMTTIKNINTIISSQLNEFQINCIVQKPNLFKQKLLYINIKPQNEIDKYVDSIVNLSKNKQINEYPQDTEIYQLTLNYLTNKGMNKTNVKTELEKIFSKNIIDDLFMFLFSQNQIKNLNVEVNKFCTYYHNHQQNTKNLKENIYCISHITFIVQLFKGLQNLIKQNKISQTEFKDNLSDFCRKLEEIKKSNPSTVLKIIKDSLSFLKRCQLELFNKEESKENISNHKIGKILTLIDEDTNLNENNIIIIEELSHETSCSSFLTNYKTFTNKFSKELQNNSSDHYIIKNLQTIFTKEKNINPDDIISSLEWLKYGRFRFNMQNTKSKEDEIMLNDLLEEESILNIKKSNFASCVDCIVTYKKGKLSFEELLALRSRFLLVLKNNTNYKIEQQNDKYVIDVVETNNNDKGSDTGTISLRQIDYEYMTKKKLVTNNMLINKKLFCEFMFKISMIIDKANEIIKKGFLFDLNYKVSINSIKKGEIQLIDSQNKQSIKIDDIIKKFQTQLDNIEKKQNKIYGDDPKYSKYILTYIYGENIGLFTQFLKTKDQFKTNIKSLLQFITDNRINEIEQLNQGKFPLKKEFYKSESDTYESISNYIDSIFKSNNITEESLFVNKLDSKDKFHPLYGKKGLFLYLFNQLESFLKQIIWLFNQTTKALPSAKNVLFCSANTSNEELKAFLYRSVLCKNNQLFTILFPENLNRESCDLLSKIIHDIKTYTYSSCIVFMFSTRTSDIYKEFQKQEIVLLEQQEEYDIDIKESVNITVIKSDVAGIGKSTYIKGKINKDHQYIYFPLGGNFSEKKTFERLLDLKMNENKKILFHLDLGDTNKEDEFNRFLFSFLILKMYSYSNKYFFVPSDMEIYIELPFGFYELDKKFKFLSLFKFEIISRKLKNLIIEKDVTSNQQIVLNYLKNYHKLNDKNVFCGEFRVDTKNPETLIETGIISEQTEIDNLIYYNNLIRVELKTHYQIKSFFDVLGIQLKYMSRDFYLEVSLLKESLRNRRDVLLNERFQQIRNIKRSKAQDEEIQKIQNQYDQSRKELLKTFEIRKELVKSFIDNTIYFIKGAYDKLIHNQKSAEYDNDSENKANNLLAMETEQICFEQIKIPLVFINEDGASLSIISNLTENSEDYGKYHHLFNSADTSKMIPLIDYKKLDHKQFVEEINKVLSLSFHNSVDYEILYNNIICDYKFTADNFIKMILILLKVRARIPVIMMGETGCGKTFLIKMLAELVESKKSNVKKNYKPNNEYKKLSQMKIFNIHAGTTDEDLMNFMEKEKLLIEDNDMSINSNNKKKLKTIWVFLDEINTCNSMDLIKEMLTNHTILGKAIKKEVTFIAACNPYRRYDVKLREKRKKYEVGLKIKEFESTKFVYSVKPLPHSLLNFVFNFGILKEKDEKEYIKSMVHDTIISSISDIPSRNEILKIIEEAIFAAQNYIRTHNDPSSVSLREVRRFIIFYKKFFEYLSQGAPSTPKDILSKESAILSIHLCYFCRIPNHDEQKAFNELITNIMKISFVDTIKREEEKFYQYVTIPPNIAKTNSLLRILFAMFFCIISKIPIFICGKPGCSKSLSFNILYNSMQGNRSEKPFFKQYPSIIKTVYQGSLGSTSKGIIEAFERAKSQVGIELKSSLSLLLFDEMGLAEISKNNPLKVMHSYLEYDEQKGKIAFVGISNWALDASKMNRGVYVSISEPSENDLKAIATTISKDTSQAVEQSYKDETMKLSKAYYKLKQREHSDGNYSLRDFYFLIRQISHEFGNHLEKLELKKINEIINLCIERNFGPDLQNGINIMKSQYYNANCSNQKYDQQNAINSNLGSDLSLSRFLMLISNDSTSHYLVQRLLENKKLEYTIFIGSQFSSDINDENYSMSVLNKIRIQLEKGIVLILKNLKIVYPSLYDLFNQNYLIIGNKKYTNIAVGYSGNFISFINDKFKCILLIDEKEYNQSDPPLRSRFDKHKYSYNLLLNEKLKDKANDIYIELTTKLFTLKNEAKNLVNEKQETLIHNIIQNQLINITQDEIYGMVYDINRKNKENNKQDNNDEDYIDPILERIVPTFSQDVIAYIYKMSNSSLLKKIFSLYKQNVKNYRNLEEYIKYISTLPKHENKKHLNSKRCVVFTFTTIVNDIPLSKIEKEMNIEKVTLSKQIKCENDIEKICDTFYNIGIIRNENPKKINVLIIRFNIDECKHFGNLSSSIDNFEKELLYQKESKFKENSSLQIIVCYIVHLKRVNPSPIQTFVSHISTEYRKVFIDNLNYKSSIKFEEILEKEENIMELKDNPFKKINSVVKDNIHEILNEIKINVLSEKNEGQEKIVEDKLKKDEGNIITNIIKYILNQKIVVFTDYFKKIDHYNSILFIKNKVSLIDIIADIRNITIISQVKLILYLLIKDSFLFPFLISKGLENQLKSNLLNYYFEKSINLGKSIVGLNSIQVIAELNIPCSNSEIKGLIRNSAQIIQKFRNESNQENYTAKRKDIFQNMKQFPILNYISEKELTIKNNPFPVLLKNDYYSLFKWNYLKDVPKEKIQNFLAQFIDKYISKKGSQMEHFAYIILLIESHSILIKNLILILMKLPQNEIDKFEIKLEESPKNYREYIKRILHLELQIVFNNLNNQKYDDHSFLQSIILYATQIESFSKIQGSNKQIVINNKQLIMFIKQYVSFKQQDNNNKIKDYLDLLKKEKQSQKINTWDIIKKEIKLIQEQENNYKKIAFLLSEKLSIYPFLSKNILEYVLKEENKLLPFMQKILCEIFKYYNIININDFYEKGIKESNLLFFRYGGETIKGECKEICKLINEELPKKSFFAHSLFYYFCSQLTIYFLQNKPSLLKKTIFPKAMKESLAYLYNADKNPCVYYNMHQFFCMAYNKVYLTYCVEYLHDCRNLNDNDKSEKIEKMIKEYIIDPNVKTKSVKEVCKKTYIQTLKLFILKLLKKYEIDIFSDKLNWFNSLLSVIKNTSNIKEKNNNSKLNVFFISTDQFHIFNKMDDIWNEIVKNKRYSDSQELVNYIKDNPEHNLYLFESFVNISFNKVLSQLYIKNQFKKIMTKEFSSFVNNILPNFKITDNASKLIELFFTQQKCETFLYKTEIINLDAKEYEIYLYAFYFALICSLNKDSFYGSLFSNQMQTLLNDNYIPGGEPNEEQIIISYYIYQATQKSYNQGFYICGGTKDKPCGTFYQIRPCGLPSQEFTCSNCDAKIAGKHHKLTKETDYRIYYDENELKAAKKLFKEANEIKHKFFSDFENEIKNKIIKSIKGMNRVTYQFFNGNIKKVRKMKTIVYRVLNFILYSCIHFAKHLGYINENNINQFIPYKIINKKCSPLKTFDVIKDNWKNIKECLTDEKDIFIFMNMLLNNTSFKQEIHNCSIQLNEQQRDSFEDAISKIIVKDENSNNIDNFNYDEFAKTYSSQRQNLLLKLNDSALLLENIINQTIVSLPSEIQNEFPQYNYFHLSTFPSENSLKTYLQNHNDVDFPLLQAYLHQKESFDFLKQLTYLNPVVNYIHDECDFKLSRSEINSKKLTECSKITSHEFKEKLDNFRRAFNKFSELDLQYECKKINNKYKIDLNKVKETPIGYFLVDNGSIRSYGIYLTAIYELLANRQNGIINSITRNKTTEIANHLKEYLEQEVMIQDANEEEILSMEYNNNNSMFNSFEEMISYFSEPCFFDNEITEIVYSKYKDISFDLTQIETQLVNVLLPGKKKLSWEDLRYINFKYEGYANNKSKIIDNYNKMYNKEELGEKTKAEILKYMNKCNCREKIYDCLQYLMHYIYRKEFPPNTKIKDVINDSEYSDKNEFSNLLKAIKKEILVTEIINFIELIEDKFFDDFKKNISPLYCDKLENEEYNKLKEWMKNSKEDQVITPKHLRNSLKKFILRFLCTQREEGILPPEQDLIIRLLNNESIWEYFVVMHPHFEIEKKDLNNTFNRVKLNCTLDFYEKLNSEINHISHK